MCLIFGAVQVQHNRLGGKSSILKIRLGSVFGQLWRLLGVFSVWAEVKFVFRVNSKKILQEGNSVNLKALVVQYAASIKKNNLSN